MVQNSSTQLNLTLKEQEILECLRRRRGNNPRLYREIVRLIRSSTESDDIRRRLGGLEKL